MNVLMIHERNKSHYVYIKDFNRLMFNKTKNGFVCIVANKAYLNQIC